LANEIYASYDEGNTLYALVWRKSDDKVYDVAVGSDTFVTYTDVDISDYAITLANQADSDFYSTNFPSGISQGVYRVQIFLQPGAIDPDADSAIFLGELYWDGIQEIDLSSINSNITVLTASGSKLLNIFGPGE
jgi:hypothetical protein